MSTEQDQESQGATEILTGAGALGAGLMAAGAAGSAAVVGGAVMVAGAAGVAIGMGIEHATDGAISNAGAEGLMSLVGEEESSAAVQAFDKGNYLEGVGHMTSGAYDTVSDAAGDAWDTVTDTASDVLNSINPFD
jgi:hypothetical protein